MRGLVLSAFIKSRHFIKQSLLLLFWLPHCKPRVDKTSQKEMRGIHQKKPTLRPFGQLSCRSQQRVNGGE